MRLCFPVLPSLTAVASRTANGRVVRSVDSIGGSPIREWSRKICLFCGAAIVFRPVSHGTKSATISSFCFSLLCCTLTLSRHTVSTVTRPYGNSLMESYHLQFYQSDMRTNPFKQMPKHGGLGTFLRKLYMPLNVIVSAQPPAHTNCILTAQKTNQFLPAHTCKLLECLSNLLLIHGESKKMFINKTFMQ